MSFLFKKQKTPQELVKSTEELIQKLDRAKTNEELSRNLTAMKNILYGDGSIALLPR
jgi:hypothetical protein